MRPLRIDVPRLLLELEELSGEGEGGAAQREALEAALRVAERHAAVFAERLEAEESARFEARRREVQRMLGESFEVELREQGQTVGALRAHINAQMVLKRVFQRTPRDRGEIPFAVDGDGQLLAAEADLRRLGLLDLRRDGDRAVPGEDGDGWVVSSVPDPDSDLIYGVARPIGDSLDQIRASSVENLVVGLAVIGLAVLAIVPLSRRISHGLEVVTAGAERIARGDLIVRVPIHSKNEIGHLAQAFNHMAKELSEHQEKLLHEERRRREQELERRLLEAEYERKSRELEDAREFQLALLPKVVPAHPSYAIAVDMRTATEVGGDYYDFALAEDGVLTIAVGDATGHGARAGTMVTVVKSLFSVTGAQLAPAEFLDRAAGTIRGMDLGRMAMSLTLARLEARTLTLATAGMPPVLVHRRGVEEVEELAIPGLPLGRLGRGYTERRLDFAGGETLLFFTDGLPELLDGGGELFGYERVRSAFAAAASGAPSEVVAHFTAAVETWTGGEPPNDDVTFVVVKVADA